MSLPLHGIALTDLFAYDALSSDEERTMRNLWAIAVTAKLTGFDRKFQCLIDKAYEYEPISSKIVKVGKTAAGGK